MKTKTINACKSVSHWRYRSNCNCKWRWDTFICEPELGVPYQIVFPISKISPPSVWRCGPTQAMTSSLTRFLDHTQRRTTVGRTPLNEWSARRRDLYLATHNTHNRRTCMSPVGFEPTISAGERLQTYDLDRAATGTGRVFLYLTEFRI